MKGVNLVAEFFDLTTGFVTKRRKLVFRIITERSFVGLVTQSILKLS